jgi:hypothetical protein
MRRILLAASVATLLLIGSSSAQAATVTVGSPLTADFNGYFTSGPSGTWANTVLSEPGANPVSPVNGTIVQWRMSGVYSGGPFTLRVLRPTSMGAYTPAGSSVPITPVGNGLQTFTTSLPIQVGDLIGIDITTGTHLSVAAVTGSHPVNWNPALADGETSPPDYINNYPNSEVGFNADVEYTPPSTTTTKKKCKKKKKKHHSAAAAKKKHCKKKKKK